MHHTDGKAIGVTNCLAQHLQERVASAWNKVQHGRACTGFFEAGRWVDDDMHDVVLRTPPHDL